MTASERNDTWARLEAEFRPYMDAEGLAFFGEGRAWQIKQHIYEQPFYYIDYCLAQTVALQFKRLADKDFAGAFARYKRFVGYCGQETFTDILRLTGLETPFDERVIEEIAGIVRARE
jgi:oligoendopeptidase F